MNYPEIIRRLYDLKQLAQLPDPGEKSGNFTSYDRASQYDSENDSYIDWGANADGTGVIRMEGKNAVVAELEGPGVIWRIWSAEPLKGHIQFYVDGFSTPTLDIPFEEYFNNKSGMFAYPELVRELSQGRNSYIPPERRQGFKYWKTLECTHNYNNSTYYAGDNSKKLTWPGYDAYLQTDDAIQYLKHRSVDKKPFALFLSWGPPHSPYRTGPKELLDYYDKKTSNFLLRKNVPDYCFNKTYKNIAGYYAHVTALDTVR